jgi:F-type H+-transporting ATPase subunit a
MTEHAAVLFHLFGLQVTSVVTTEWGVMLVILLLTYFGTRNLKKVPHGVQNILEFVIDGLYNFFSGILGREKARKYLPFLMTMFVFILLSNYSGLIPGSGHVNGMKAPTSSLSVTAGLAIVV